MSDVVRYFSVEDMNDLAVGMNEKQKTIFGAKSVSDQLVADVDTIGDTLDEVVSDVAVLEGRVDNITSLPAGSVSTSADAELVDIRVGADGTVYSTAGNAVRGQISDLQDVLDKSFISKTIKNSDFSVTGYVQANGVFASTGGFLSTPLIELNSKICRLQGTLQSVKQALLIISYYNADQEFISGINGTSATENVVMTFDEFVPHNAKYVRFSTRQAYINDNTVSITIDEFVADETLALSPVEFYVGYGTDDDERNFDSVVDCLTACSQMPNVNKIIHILDGEYDILNELGGMAYILAHNTTDDTIYTVQPWVNNVKIIGHGNVVLNFNITDGTPSANYWLFSCLNVRGNVEIENIEIHSSNCRYSIHDENSTLYPNTFHKYKNVRCYQNVYHAGQGAQALGCGFSKNSIIDIESCHFENGGGASSGESWSCHANDGCSFNFTNTIFKHANSNNGGVRLSQNGAAKLYAMIANCFVSNKLVIRNEWTDASIEDDTKIDLINTPVTIDSNYAVVNEPVKSYNTLAGTETTLLDVTS